jgi:tRNA(Ile)-lysidine synthase
LVLHAAHLHHGLRGAEADRDMEFCRALAGELGVEFHTARVNVAAEAAARGETTEEAARRARYAWFRRLMAETPLDAVATAHTQDDQAETVLGKFLRGAWTEGLSGIHLVVEFAEGRIVRPLLGVRRAEVEAYLRGLGQAWCEDSTNQDAAYTRNRIRHELLPELERWNPQIREKLAQMAELAREEERWWQGELERVAPQLILEGRAVRGGGRAAGGDLLLLPFPAKSAENRPTNKDLSAGVPGDGAPMVVPASLSFDVTRLAGLDPALERRLIRFAAAKLGREPDFAATEALRRLAHEGSAGQKLELAGGLRAERSPRELRLSLAAVESSGVPAAVEAEIPGVVEAPDFGLRLRVETDTPGRARLRVWKAGDRVRLRYSSGPRKVKEVLERLRVTCSDRARWPVLEVAGRIVWMEGAEVEPEPGIRVIAEAAGGAGGRRAAKE